MKRESNLKSSIKNEVYKKKLNQTCNNRNNDINFTNIVYSFSGFRLPYEECLLRNIRRNKNIRKLLLKEYSMNPNKETKYGK